MAGFASEGCAVGASLCLAIFEFAVVRIYMASGASAIFESERQNLVLAACGSRLVTIGTGHGGVCSGQSEMSVAVLRDGKERTVPVAHGMTIFAFVQMRSGGELAVMRVLVTVRAERKLQFVNCVLASG